MNHSNLLIATLFYFIMASCGSRQSSPSSANEGSAISNSATGSVETMQSHPGKRVYDQYCKACHLDDGRGMRGMHPPLIKNKTVNGNVDKLIDITLNGMTGKIVIDGVEYNGIMPPHLHLTDQQVADVLTYVRQSFGNQSGPVTSAQVVKHR